MTGIIKFSKIGVLLLIPSILLLYGNGGIKSKNSLNPMAPERMEVDSVPLFNGVDLNNWDFVTSDTLFHGNKEDIFTIENGVIHVYAHQQPLTTQTFAGLYTKESYHNYRLTLEYKWGEKKFKPRHESVRDAGVLFHVYRVEVFWPFGVECQIQEGDTGDVWVIGTQVTSRVSKVVGNYDPEGNLVTKGNRPEDYNRFSRSYSWEVPGWNKIEIELIGDHAKYWVNGHLVNEAIYIKNWSVEKETWEPLTTGRILLQAEGAEVFYKNIFLTQL